MKLVVMLELCVTYVDNQLDTQYRAKLILFGKMLGLICRVLSNRFILEFLTVVLSQNVRWV